MSYSITCYANDNGISLTKIEVTYIGLEREIKYGDTYYAEGFAYNAKFTATPANGYEFTRWGYRIGSISSAQQFSQENPFIYTGRENIYIRAESTSVSGGGDSEKDFSATIEDVSSDGIATVKITLDGTSWSEYINEDYSIYINSEAEVCSGTIDSTTLENGIFADISEYGFGTFSFRLLLPNANPPVIVEWENVEVVDNSEEPQPDSWTLNFEDLSEIGNGVKLIKDITIEDKNMFLFKFRPAKSCDVEIYTTGSCDTMGYLSSNAQWDKDAGTPNMDYVLATDDDGGENNNFMIAEPLYADINYYVFIRTYKGVSGSTTVHIDARRVTVPKWDWETPIYMCSTEILQKAYNAVTTKGETLDFSYGVWNAMVRVVNSILNSGNRAWDDKYATYNDTLMKSGSDDNKTLTAARFNSLRYNIDHYYLGSNNITGIGEVKSGDTVYGWYFTKLAECINLWIDYEGLGN